MVTTFAPQLAESKPHTTSTQHWSTNTATLSKVEVDSDVSNKDNDIVGGISADIGGPLIHSDNLHEIDSPGGLGDSVPGVGVDPKAQDHTGQSMTYSIPTDPDKNTDMPPVTHDKKSDNHNSSDASTNVDKSFSTVAKTTEIALNNMPAVTRTSSKNISVKSNIPVVSTANTSPSPISSSAMNSIITLLSGNVHTSTKTSEIPRTTLSSSTMFPTKESDSSSIDLAKVTLIPSPNGPSSEPATHASPSLPLASPESEYLPENCKGDKSAKLMAKSGFITSPGFENNQPYPPNISCNWEIEDQKHEVVTLYKLLFFVVYCSVKIEEPAAIKNKHSWTGYSNAKASHIFLNIKYQ